MSDTMHQMHGTGDTGAVQPAIELRGIDKRFGAVHANKEIDLKVDKGTIHGIVGENGAGKSTLMSILYGFYQADAGTIHVDGNLCDIKGSEDAISAGIGMVHQHFMLVEPFTVLENVILGVEGGAILREGVRVLARQPVVACSAVQQIDPGATENFIVAPVTVEPVRPGKPMYGLAVGIAHDKIVHHATGQRVHISISLCARPEGQRICSIGKLDEFDAGQRVATKDTVDHEPRPGPADSGGIESGFQNVGVHARAAVHPIIAGAQPDAVIARTCFENIADIAEIGMACAVASAATARGFGHRVTRHELLVARMHLLALAFLSVSKDGLIRSFLRHSYFGALLADFAYSRFPNMIPYCFPQPVFNPIVKAALVNRTLPLRINTFCPVNDVNKVHDVLRAYRDALCGHVKGKKKRDAVR